MVANFFTKRLYLDDAYLAAAEAKVIAHCEGNGFILNRSIFNTADEQAPDRGYFEYDFGETRDIENPIIDYVVLGDSIVFIGSAEHPRPQIGSSIVCHLDWDFRYYMMRLHSACHCVAAILGAQNAVHAIKENWAELTIENNEIELDLKIIQQKFENIVAENLPIEVGIRGDKRHITIGQSSVLDTRSCDGTHVSETAEIGGVLLTSTNTQAGHSVIKIILND